MSELLLELCSGEIPAMMQQKAAIAYKDIFAKYFTDNAIKFDQIDVYVGPRRLTIHATGVATKLAAITKELKGPKVSAPQGAIDGFCRSNNITAAELTRTEIKGVELYVYEQKTPEQNTKDILLDSLHRPISEYVWPKSMYWGRYKIKWVRPLQNILCIFNAETIPFEYGHITANNQCYGHRFMAPEAHAVSSFVEYKKILEDSFVVLDSVDRKEYIQDGLAKEAKKLGLIIKEDPALLEEVIGLVEYPQVLVGKIDQKFLSVPSEILVNAMRAHQKYFSLFDEDGNFAPYFLFVSNIASTDTDVVISGNEKVLSARLADSLYFYNQDLKTSLQTKAQRLEKVIFHAKLGSVREKTLRLAEIVKFIDPSNEHAVQAALLCKSDIVSEVVDEFPTLQGIMGYYYAKSESLNSEVAIAIRDHYKPQGPADHCPTNTAAILALADKMDSLCGLMLAGEKPSGSKDPFALRRQALGIIRIILENKVPINLLSLVVFVANEYKGKLEVKGELKLQIISFLEERLKYFFKDHYEVTVIASVLDLNIESDLIEVQSKLQAIKEFLSSVEGDDLLIAYKRASNILGTTELQGKIDESVFVSEYEIALFSIINSCDSKITESIVSKNYTESLQLLASMRDPISKFFDNVMVKDKDAIIANNRMLLLAKVRQIFDKIANFDKL
jgi:glycyl-tRNA synthetase beta chain